MAHAGGVTESGLGPLRLFFILLGPAMYAAEAYAVPFNAGFTEFIRRPNTWESSDAWELLACFTGCLLLVAGERDPVIPTEVIQRIYSAAHHAKGRSLFVAPGAPHLILTDLRSNAPINSITSSN